LGLLAGVVGLALIAVVLLDAFETLVLPRRVDRAFRFATLYYRSTWRAWVFVTRLVRAPEQREALLSNYGPASLIVLLIVWAGGLVVGFALVQWALGLSLHAATEPNGPPTLGTAIYFSGTTFFTLGFGDITPISPPARAVSVIEAGLGFGFLALIISYLPTLNGPLTERERVVTMLDARAGAPPSAAEVLRRHTGPGATERLQDLLVEWERWAAATLNSHLSYPLLAYFRSQHDNESWVAALATVLDTCALLVAGGESVLSLQAQLTLDTATHAAIDLSQFFRGRYPAAPAPVERLTADEVDRLRVGLQDTLMACSDEQKWAAFGQELYRQRTLYEPHLEALAAYLQMPLPRFVPPPDIGEHWSRAV